MNYYCYANGKILRKSDIKVGINDLVMLRGYGAFDFMRTYYGVPFRMNDYLERFENSAKGMKLKLPLRRKEIIAVINKLLRKNRKPPLSYARNLRLSPKGGSREMHLMSSPLGGQGGLGIRLLLTGGYSLDSYLPAAKPNLFILIEDLPTYPEWWSEKGIKLMLHEHSREMAKVKTTNYLTAIRLADARRKHKAQDTLYCSDGKILETTRNNFFLFHGDTLVTSQDDILHGITRKAVLEISGKMFKVEIREVLKAELKNCTECFITGTTRGITPVVQIDDLKIGNGRAGENTKKLMKMFQQIAEKECTPK